MANSVLMVPVQLFDTSTPPQGLTGAAGGITVDAYLIDRNSGANTQIDTAATVQEVAGGGYIYYYNTPINYALYDAMVIFNYGTPAVISQNPTIVYRSAADGVNGDVQGKVLGKDFGWDALTDVGVRADVRQWLGSGPDALSSGKVPVDVKLWLTDTPNALAAGRVDAVASQHSGTCQSGSTTTTIKLATGAASTDSRYNDCLVWLTGGTGAGQVRLIIAYTGSTRVATVARNWDTTPDATTTYTVMALGQVAVTSIRSSVAQSGSTSSTIKLDAGASTTDNLYNDAVVLIIFGTGAGQARRIASYAGSTRVATIAPNWTTTPDATSFFTILPSGQADLGAVLGTAVTATTAGVLDINVKNYNNQTAQTDANNLPKVDLEDIRGTASSASVGTVGIDWNVIANKTASANLSSTSIAYSGSLGSSVTIGASGIDSAAFTGNATTALGTAIWSSATRVLTAGTNIVLTKGVGLLGLNDITGSSVTATISGYATGQDPATLLFLTPANKLATASDGSTTATVKGSVSVGTNSDKTGYTLTSAYDAAKTAAQAGDQMNLADGAITENKITPPTETTGVPVGILQNILWIAGMAGRRKVVQDTNALTIKQYMSDDTTTRTTNTYTQSGGVITINKAS